MTPYASLEAERVNEQYAKFEVSDNYQHKRGREKHFHHAKSMPQVMGEP